MHLVRAALALVAASLAGAGPLLAALPDGFVLRHMVEAPAGGKPIGFTWLPDERIVVITRNGEIRLSVSAARCGSVPTECCT